MVLLPGPQNIKSLDKPLAVQDLRVRWATVRPLLEAMLKSVPRRVGSSVKPWMAIFGEKYMVKLGMFIKPWMGQTG